MPRFTAIYQVDFLSPTEVEAIMVGEEGRKVLLDFVDEDDDDTVDLIDLAAIDAPMMPVVDIRALRNSRNILLRTRNKEAYDVARSLDQWAFMHGQYIMGDSPLELVNYDWSKFMEVLQEVLNGKNPLDY